MKTILVTGGTGFIGNCFCKLLLKERSEYRVINVDVCTYAANPSTIEEELKNPNYKFYKKFCFFYKEAELLLLYCKKEVLNA